MTDAPDLSAEAVERLARHCARLSQMRGALMDDALSDAAATLRALSSENTRLRAETETLTTSGIIEVATRNPNVMDYVRHWEGRAEKAEAEVESLRADLAAAERKGAEAWQPIETAPKDQAVLLWRPSMRGGEGRIGKGKWNPDPYAKRPRPFWESTEGWIGKVEDRQHPPTDWQPLPLPPSTREGE